MTKKVDTWMPFLIDKYLGDTTHLTTEQHGAYMLLLLTMWKRGGELPSDDIQLAAISRLAPARWRSHRAVILAFFDADAGVLRQKRLTMELEAANKRSTVKAAAGAEGARSKWGEAGGASAAATRSARLAEARAKGSHTKGEWTALCDVLGNACVKCAIPAASLEGGALTKDHIQPIYQGGDDSLANLQPMCRNCNSRKGNETTDYRGARVKDWRERLSERLANAWQTPASISTPSAIADTETPSGVSARGAVGKALKAAGVDMTRVNMADPRLLALIDQGATPEEFEGLGREAVAKRIEQPLGWICTALMNRRAQAASMVLAPPPAPSDAWRKTERGIRLMAAQLSVENRPDETFEAWDRRVLAAWRRAGEPQPQPAEIAA